MLNGTTKRQTKCFRCCAVIGPSQRVWMRREAAMTSREAAEWGARPMRIRCRDCAVAQMLLNLVAGLSSVAASFDDSLRTQEDDT